MDFWYEWLHAATQGANDPAAWCTCAVAFVCVCTVLAAIRGLFK